MKREEYFKKTSSSSSKFFMNDLDKELLAAEKFLNKNNDEILKINSTSSNSDFNSSILDLSEKNIDKRIDPSLLKYKKQLKSFGFPEIGEFYFNNDNIEDKQKTFNFFDYLIMKKSTENEEKMRFKKQVDSLTNRISIFETEKDKLERELINYKEEMKKISKDKKDFESKLNKSKESLEKQYNELKTNNLKMINKYNTVLIEKKSYEEKYNKIAENYQKIINKNNLNFKPINHIEMIEGLRKNDMIKILSKVKGTEKLIETVKNGFNESLRELLFEISALKNFLYEVNSDIINSVSSRQENLNFLEIEYSLLNMPFLDTVNKIKYVFKNNLKILKKYKNIAGNTIFNENNELEMTFDKNENKYENKNEPSLIFDIEDNLNININSNLNNNLNNNSDSNFFTKEDKINTEEINDDAYEKELEFLKNKWVKTLMNIKSKTSDDEN